MYFKDLFQNLQSIIYQYISRMHILNVFLDQKFILKTYYRISNLKYITIQNSHYKMYF